MSMNLNTPEEVAKLMVDGFTDRVRQILITDILKKIMPDVEAAADNALEGFKIAVQHHRDYAKMESIVKVILEKK